MPVTNPSLPVQEAWQAPTLSNGWVNYGSDGTGTYNIAGYWKDSLGIVHLRGLIKSGPIGQSSFTLPIGYRPVARELFLCFCGNPTPIFGRLDIPPTGQVIPFFGGNAYFSLDGISFRAAS